MPLITAAIMDTDRIIPQTGSSPGSNQSSTGQAGHPVQSPMQAYSTPNLPNGQQSVYNGGHYASGSNPVRVKKKGDRTVAPPPPPTQHLMNNSYANTTPLQQHIMHSSGMTPSNGVQHYPQQYSTYTPDLNGGLRSAGTAGITNHAYARDTLG